MGPHDKDLRWLGLRGHEHKGSRAMVLSRLPESKPGVRVGLPCCPAPVPGGHCMSLCSCVKATWHHVAAPWLLCSGPGVQGEG